MLKYIKTHIRTICGLSLFLVVLIVCNQYWRGGGDQPVRVWTCNSYPVQSSVPRPWTVHKLIDTKEKVIFSVIDFADGKSYTINVQTDSLKRFGSKDQIYETMITGMLSLDKSNSLIESMDVRFHETDFHLMRFKMTTKPWGVLDVSLFLKVMDDKFVSVQVAFP